ncbi:MAG: FHA domain-containing protein [Planctomycetota bacterium]|nr:MAG: FHA domain-containing protein [Planctomycetota bacterium]
MLGQLVPCGGGDPIPLLKPKLLVGRRSQCDIALRFPNVSSHHCELEFKDGYWFVRDLNSRNGIKVNGVRCDQKWLLPGDILSIARHKYEIQYTPQSDAPPPEVEEDPFSRSLLEKAGLERRRPSRPSRPSRSAPSEPPRPRPAPRTVNLDEMSEEERLAWEFLQQSEQRRDNEP